VLAAAPGRRRQSGPDRLCRKDTDLRARVLLADGAGFRYGCELDATDPDDVWRQAQGDRGLAGRNLREGDVVYLGDVYLALDGDGGWNSLEPGDATKDLYRLIVEAERAE
jgi:hypothetical protein